MTKRLYYGDNLEVLREHIGDASVDLIYLDPPFNSNASYNVLFRAPSGGGTDASIEAFDDTWQWGPSAEDALADIRSSGNHKLHTLMAAIRTAPINRRHARVETRKSHKDGGQGLGCKRRRSTEYWRRVGLLGQPSLSRLR